MLNRLFELEKLFVNFMESIEFTVLVEYVWVTSFQIISEDINPKE